MRTSDPGGSFGGASDDSDRGDPRRPRVTLRDAPYRARSLGGGTQVVVNLADHAAQIASSSVGPRRRRRDVRSARRLERGAADADAAPPPVREDQKPFQKRKKNGEASPFLSRGLLRAAVTTDVDGLWQVHPRRLLEYSPRDLHTKGWFPWPSRYHISVTVFASPELHAQTLVLAAWTAAIHATGLGVEDSKQSGFKAIFGTAYLGSLASMGVIIALVLGLFISLVVQRWWDVRSQYATFHHALLELAVAFAADARLGTERQTKKSAVTAITARFPHADRRRETSSESSESSAEDLRRLRRDATRELFRLLNLAHVLFLSQAGEREHAVTGARRLRRAGRFFSTPSRFVTSRDARNARGGNDEGSSLDESLGDEATRRVSDPSDDSIGDSGARRGVDAVAVAATAGTNAESLADVRTDSDIRTPRRERFRGASSPRSLSEGTNASRSTRFRTEPRDRPRRPSAAASVASTAVFADDANILAKHVTHLDRDDCVALGLVTAEEWEALRAARAAGLPRFSAVLCWAHALLETCAARRVCSSAAKRTAIAKLADARQAAGRVSTYLMSQLPYTYVNLVSLVVHVYLFVLATWFGFILHSGLNAVEMNVAASAEIARVAEAAGAEGVSRDGIPLEPGETTPNVFRVSERRVPMSSDVLTVAFCYAFLAFSNVLFQGLLHIHALLDNPFGHHPAKFPLRQFVAQLVGQTSALLAGAHEPPAASPSVAMFRRSESGGESEEEREDPRA